MNNSRLSPGAIWITGLSASGKTTLGKTLCNRLKGQGFTNYTFLDGEELRARFNNKFGYSVEERFALAENIVKVAQEESSKGNLVLIATITHKVEMRQMAREALQPFMEVYLKCPVEVCAKRDYKGHYQHAFAGEYKMFVGVTEPYEVSEHPELVLETSKLSTKESADILLQKTLDMFDSLALTQKD